MNARISYKWLKDYVDLKGITPEDFAKRMSLAGPAVEKIHPFVGAQGMVPLDEKVVVGHVLEVKTHPNADKLKIAMVDVGGKEKIQVVCGGSNLKQDQWIAVALVGARVRWHGQGDLVTLEPTEIRGVKSEGMICAASEIGLFDAFPHAEREILDLNVAPTPGQSLAKFLGLDDDVILDIEVTTNRVDAMGMVGMAREAGAVLNRKMLYKTLLLKVAKSKNKFSVKVSSKNLCPRYMAVRMDGIKIGPSPWWLKQRLMSAGLNSINNVVDITNYVMLELAQPMHAFDADRIEKGIDVRLARKGEKIKTLDGQEHALTDKMLVIADGKQPIAIAGVMGGEESAIQDTTTSIILEAATFDSVSIRRTARALNLQSDSQLRYEKGLSTEALPFALARAVELVKDLAGGNITSLVSDVRAGSYKPLRFSISSDEIASLMGVSLPMKNMVAILKRLGFIITTQGKTIRATVPWWRDKDIELPRDLVEEVARVYGYANIPPVVPIGLATRQTEPELIWEDRVRDLAKGAGLIEAYGYSFTSREILQKASYDPDKMLRVQNPLTMDLEIMRTTLLPSLLQVAHENRERESRMRLFEVANVYYPSHSKKRSVRVGRDDTRDGLPDEQLELGALFYGMDDAWKEAKGFVEHLLSELGIPEVSWQRLSSDSFWHTGRTVQAFVNGDLLATVGEVSSKISHNFKLDQRVAMIDMPLETVFRFATQKKSYVPLPIFPVAKRDIAIVLNNQTEYEDVARAIRRVDARVTQIEWFDTYHGEHVPDGKKSLAMHVTFTASDRTLESQEVDELMRRALETLKKEFGAEARG